MNTRRRIGSVLASWMVAVVGVDAQDTRVLDAARVADTAGVVSLLREGVPARAAQPDGATALHWAAHWDDVTMADALIDVGATVDATNDFGVTPLWLASLNGSGSMVARLLLAGADPNATLPSGETVLMTAARTGSAESVGFLVGHGANVDATEQARGQTALMWAVAQQHADVVATLVKFGADVHARSAPVARRIHTRTAGFNPIGVVDVVQGGFTPLLFAARRGDLASAMYLVAGGADVNDTAFVGTSALVVAAHSGHTAVAQYLLEQGADPNADEAGYTALHAAILRGDVALVNRLLASGAETDVPVRRGSAGRRNSPDYVLEHDLVGATAYWLAARFAEPSIMRALIEHGADTQVTMGDGTTPLMAATGARRRREPGLAANPIEEERRVLEAARLALDGGVEVNATDASGNSALHTAASRRLDTVVRLLVEHQADVTLKNGSGQTPIVVAAGRSGVENSTVELLRQLGASEE